MELQVARQIDYLQRTLSIFLSNANDMSERFESLIDELIKENKQINNKSPKHSPESSSSDSKSDAMTNGNSPQPLTQKKRSATSAANSKPPPTKRLKAGVKDDDDDDDEKKNSSSEETNDDDDDNDEIKAKTNEPQAGSRDINEFAIEIGLVCHKCMVLTEEKDNRLVECHECHLRYHQKCHKPPVSTADISDPRSLWYCAKCRRIVLKRQSQSTIKEIKSNSNSSSSSSHSSTNKPKGSESILSSVKKGLTSSITDVTTGFFTLKAKSSDSLSSDNNTSHSTSQLNSSSSTPNNGSTTKNTNGWASLVTGSKEKKPGSETSSSSIFTDLTGGTTNETKSSLNSLNKTPFNGGNLGLLKASSSTVLSTIKPAKPSSPPVLKTPPLASSTLKSTTKVFPAGKPIQRISSPTPLGRASSTMKSPPPPPAPTSTTRSPSSSTTTTGNAAHLKIPSGLDCEKRLKKMRKLAAEKTLTKKY